MADRSPFDPSAEGSRILAAIVESSDDAIIGKDLEGIVVTWNRGAERLYGYAADEMKGRSVAHLIPDGHANELPEILEHIRQGRRVEGYETTRVTKDGRMVDISLTVSPIADAAGNIVGAATIARDITERKRAEQAINASEARWRSVIESAVDGIIVIDARGRIETFNPAAERQFGYEASEVLGKNVSMLMPAPYNEEHDGYIAHYLTTGVPKIIGIGRQVTALRKDGSTFPARLAVGEARVNGEPKFTGILHELTERVKLEEQLSEQTAMARLGQMAAVVAHEIKNPLAGIRGAIQVIGGRLPKESRDASIVKEIVREIDGLNGLMKDLLLFARPPQPHLVPLDVGALVQTTASLLAEDPAFGGITVAVAGTAPPVQADPALLKIVFINLLVNSAHAMQGQGSIQVSLTTSGDRVQVEVRDTGPGIPSDVREKIFTPFFTTKARGTGLGLPTAKRIVEAHAGTIGIDCPFSGGTTILVEFPAAK